MAARRSRLSLTGRLLLTALLWLAAAVGVGAWELDRAFRDDQADRLNAKLAVLAQVVAGAVQVAPDGTVAVQPVEVGDLSGADWYWQVRLPDGTVLRSDSLGDHLLRQSLAAAPGEVLPDETDDGPFGAPVVTTETAVVPAGLDGPAHVKVAIAGDEVQAALTRFRGILAGAGIMLGSGLAALIVWQVRWGLRPLQGVIGDLRAVKNGEADRLSEDVPAELADLVGAFNDVLDHDRRIVERARSVAGDLAHALKTEIAVLRTEVAAAAEPQVRGRLEERTARLTALVERHLGRGALVAGGAGGAPAGLSTDPRPVIADIVTMMRAVFAERGLDISADTAASPAFRGERDDLVELIGNLVENACKHAIGAVRVSARGEAERLVVQVEDDGPGIPRDVRAEALQRGRRLDERAPGSGLGLAIVADLAEMYGGTVTLGDSPLGGLLARLDLPAARVSRAA